MLSKVLDIYRVLYFYILAYVLRIINSTMKYNQNRIIIVGRYGHFIDNSKYAFLQLFDYGFDVWFITFYKKEVESISDRYKKKMIVFDFTTHSFVKLSKLFSSSYVLVVDDPQWVKYGFGVLAKHMKKIMIRHGIGPKLWTTKFRDNIVFSKMFFDLNIKYDIIIELAGLIPTLVNSTYNFWRHTNYFLPIGYPRNVPIYDINKSYLVDKETKKLYNTIKSNFEKGKKIILFAPTFTKKGAGLFEIVNQLYQGLKDLDNFLLVLKPHPAHKIEVKKYMKLNNKILVVDSTRDIYPIMKFVDILITDLSSIYIDLLVSKEAIPLFLISKNFDYGAINLIPCVNSILDNSLICSNVNCLIKKLKKILDDKKYLNKLKHKITFKVRSFVNQDPRFLNKFLMVFKTITEGDSIENIEDLNLCKSYIEISK